MKKERVFLPEMSRKYGVKVFTFDNPQFPYFVDGINDDDEFGRECGCTEEEIKDFVDYHHKTDALTPWACQIIGWYNSLKDEPERADEIELLLDEIGWYIDTMFNVVQITENTPEWIANFVYDCDENWDASFGAWCAVIDKVIPNLK